MASAELVLILVSYFSDMLYGPPAIHTLIPCGRKSHTPGGSLCTEVLVRMLRNTMLRGDTFMRALLQFKHPLLDFLCPFRAFFSRPRRVSGWSTTVEPCRGKSKELFSSPTIDFLTISSISLVLPLFDNFHYAIKISKKWRRLD